LHPPEFPAFILRASRSRGSQFRGVAMIEIIRKLRLIFLLPPAAAGFLRG